MTKRKFTDRWAIKYPENPNFQNINLNKNQQFKKNWIYSFQKMGGLNEKLNIQFKEDSTFSVLVAGSFGRLDAHQKSDLDFMIIHNGHISNENEKIITVRECATELEIGLPNPEGAFSRPINLKSMINTIGAKEDDLNKTAQRLLILMECRPIYNEILYKNITTEILNHYLKLVSEEPEKEPLVLLNDIIKYFRNICINVEFSFWQDEDKWGIRNIKLRHSRVLMYAGLLLLLLNSSKYREKKISYLTENIHLSPIEKIFQVYNDNDDFNFDRVISAYNNFLTKLVSDNVREELKNLDYGERYLSSNYSELKTNSEFLQSEFTRFILSHRHNWSSKIFEYLIF